MIYICKINVYRLWSIFFFFCVNQQINKNYLYVIVIYIIFFFNETKNEKKIKKTCPF